MNTRTSHCFFCFLPLWRTYFLSHCEGIAGENPDRPDRLNVDQQVAYELIGQKLLGYYWEGYDVCMFAYGQSGAGKSFSMVGIY